MAGTNSLIPLILYSTGAFVVWMLKGFKKGTLKKEFQIYELNAQFWFYSFIGLVVIYSLFHLGFYLYDLSHESDIEKFHKLRLETN